MDLFDDNFEQVKGKITSSTNLIFYKDSFSKIKVVNKIIETMGDLFLAVIILVEFIGERGKIRPSRVIKNMGSHNRHGRHRRRR